MNEDKVPLLLEGYGLRMVTGEVAICIAVNRPLERYGERTNLAVVYPERCEHTYDMFMAGTIKKVSESTVATLLSNGACIVIGEI